MNPIGLATANLLSPMVRFFALALDTARLRSSLSCPEAVSRGLAIYLLAAIGFKGGASISEQVLDSRVLVTLTAGAVISAVMPIIAFWLLRATTKLDRVDIAAMRA